MQQNQDFYTEHPCPAFWVLLLKILTVPIYLSIHPSIYPPILLFDAPQTKLQISIYLRFPMY